MSNKEKLIGLLNLCTEPQMMIFKRMYSPTNLDDTIEEIVMDLYNELIPWAIVQAERAVEKNMKNRKLKLKKIKESYESKKRICK